MKDLIGVEYADAQYLLTTVYGAVADQVLDPVTLGGVPNKETESYPDAEMVTLLGNPFFWALWKLISDEEGHRKLLVTPEELEKRLKVTLEDAVRIYILEKFGTTLTALGADLDSAEGQDDAIKMAKEQFAPIAAVHQTWMEIVNVLVGILTWRHLARVKGNNDDPED